MDDAAYQTNEQKKRDLLKAKWEHYAGGDLREYECPGCGWHISSHSISSYGLDCTSGTTSPAVRERRMPVRKAKFVFERQDETDG